MGVNYIWDLLIKAENEGLHKQHIQFFPATSYSPYMELSYEMVNAETIDEVVEVNPYYRYYEIFKELFPPDSDGEEALKHPLFDLILHFLAEIDLMQGMNKREFYIQFILKDIEAGVFGKSVQKKIKGLTKTEQVQVAMNILCLYETGDELHLLKDTMRKLFKNCVIYFKSGAIDELLIYIGEAKCEILQSKVELIQEVFLPIRFQTKIYWREHFGIIGEEETMRLDQIALY